MAGVTSVGPDLKQRYTLQAADPTISPAPGNYPYTNGGTSTELPYEPVMSSITTGATLRYGAGVTCATGTTTTNPSPALLFPVSNDTTYSGVACKPGYAPSNTVSFAYTVTLNAPVFPATATLAAPGAGGTYDHPIGTTLGSTTYVGFDFVDTNAGTSSTEWMCYSTDGSTPSCGLAAMTCGTATPQLPVAAPFAAPAVTKTGTTVNVVACALGYNGSAASSATYALQYPAPGLDEPGCTNTATGDITCTDSTAGAPILSYTLTRCREELRHIHLQDRGELGSGGAQVYDYACVINHGTPACGPAGTCMSGTKTGTNGSFGTANTVALGSLVAPGDVWSVIGCEDPADLTNHTLNQLTSRRPR